jgi:porin
MKLPNIALLLAAGLLSFVCISTTQAQVVNDLSDDQFSLDEPPIAQTDALPISYDNLDATADGYCDPCCNDFWTRQKMFGDWHGARSGLACHGIVADLQLTQFYQNVASGGNRRNDAYGGKMDYMFTFLGEPLGLNEGFVATLHAETRFGNDINLDAVGFSPSNVNMLYPSLENTTAITGLQFIQMFNEDWGVTFGKFNMVDFFDVIYPQLGRGVNGFMNISSVAPLTISRTLPLSFLGAGMLKMHEGKIQGALVVYDSNNITTTSGFENLFDNGANIVGLWRFFSECGGLPGSHLFLGTWANGDYDSLDPTGWSFIPETGLVPGQETGTWSATYFLEQQLWVDSCNENRNIGLLSEFGMADPKTTAYEWAYNVSLQGQGLVGCREHDTMGVAYFYNSLSGDFKTLLNPAPFQVDDLQGVELYYNAAITPWFHLTADLQVVEPANTANDTAVVFGLRGKLDF